MKAKEWLLEQVGYARREHKSALFYTASTLSKTFVQLVASLVTVRFVAPAELGLWNSIALATTYAVLLQAGVNNGLGRELPHYLGKGDDERADRLASTALIFTMGACLAAMVIGAAALVWFRDRGPVVVLAISAEIIVVLFTLYQGYLAVTFRSKSSFQALGKTEFLNAALGLLLLPLVVFFRFAGMLVRIILVSLASGSLLHAIRPMRVSLTWDTQALKDLLKTGIPIFALHYVEASCGTFDRLFLLQRGGVEQVGYYSLGLMAQGAMLVIPFSLSMYMYPRMTFELAKENNLHALWRRAWKTTVAVFAVMLPLTIAAVLALPWLVPLLFPKYIPGIRAAQVLVVAALFCGAAVGVNALWSMKAWRYMAAYQLLGAGFRALGPFLGITLYPDPLSGVAWGMLGAYVAQLALALLLTYHATHRGGAGLDGTAEAASEDIA